MAWQESAEQDRGTVWFVGIEGGAWMRDWCRGWKLIVNGRSGGNFGDGAGAKRGEGGWRRRSGGKWFAGSRQAGNSGSGLRSSSRGRTRKWDGDGCWARAGRWARDFGSCRRTGCGKGGMEGRWQLRGIDGRSGGSQTVDGIPERENRDLKSGTRSDGESGERDETRGWYRERTGSGIESEEVGLSRQGGGGGEHDRCGSGNSGGLTGKMTVEKWSVGMEVLAGRRARDGGCWRRGWPEACRRWRGWQCGGPEAAAAAAWGRRHRDDGGEEPWPGQGVVAVVAAAAVGLLSWPSLSSHLRGRSLISFFKWRLGFVGGVPSPLIEPIMGREGKGPTWGQQPTPNMLIERNKVHKKRWASRMGSRKGKNPPGSLKGREEVNEDPLKHVRVKSS